MRRMHEHPRLPRPWPRRYNQPHKETIMIRRRSLHGFTLIELLVVIAIVGLLVACCCRQSRRPANRAPLAVLQQFAPDRRRAAKLRIRVSHAAGRLRSQFTANGTDTGPGWGWAAFLLPGLEESSLSRLLRLDRPIEDPLNAQVRTQSVPVFLCPSDSVARFGPREATARW